MSVKGILAGTFKTVVSVSVVVLGINAGMNYLDNDGEIQRAKAAINKQINDPDRFVAMEKAINKEAKSVNILSRQFQRMILWKDSANAIDKKALVAKALKVQKVKFSDTIEELNAKVDELKKKAVNLSKANNALKAKTHKGKGKTLLNRAKNKALRTRK